MLGAITERQRPASEVCRLFTPIPQRLRSIGFAGASPLRNPRAQDAINEADAVLDGKGRLLLRESGTEPVIRVMVECEDEWLLAGVMDLLCGTISEVATRKLRPLPSRCGDDRIQHPGGHVGIVAELLLAAVDFTDRSGIRGIPVIKTQYRQHRLAMHGRSQQRPSAARLPQVHSTRKSEAAGGPGE